MHEIKCYKFNSHIILFHKQLVQGSKQPIGATFPIKPSSVDKWDTDYRGGQGKLERDNKISFIQL